ncbi:repressor of the inhibitor of the protein kinase [Amphibalanus amphitrite]|uniref:Repressor of the inhibitor of the protein kinase n=1 Tax=Amphibalanus amphitrite TaxID=1232801 RepID=A0A6A4W7C2_AMPAM|nr:repressor of the inhibitor of the protein kinase [Amphibalanus amphitrite]
MFSVIADETTDKGIREQLAIVLRYVDPKGDVREDLISLLNPTETTGSALADAIIDSIQGVGLSVEQLPRLHLLEGEVEATLPESRRKRMKALCRTRWVEQHDSILTFDQLLPALVSALEKLQVGGSSEASTKATMLLGAICRFEFLIALQMAVLIFGITLKLSVALQSPSRTLADCMQLVEVTASTVSQSRTEFHSVFQKANTLASSLNVPITAPRKTGRQMHRANCGSSDNVEDHYRINGWNVVVDETVAELRRRFPRDHPALKLEGILPRNIAMADMEGIEASAAFYDADLPQPSGLRSELLLWKQMCTELSDKGQSRTLPEMYRMATTLPNVQAMLRILLTVPATSCSAERTFSAH